MSGGIPEMLNDNQETFDYSRAKETVREIGQKSP